MANLPQAVIEYNKKFGNKIALLKDAKAMHLKRMFSGSFGLDLMLGGGWAYKRIQLLYGAKSSGKNSLLYQTTAYNQRLCRNCQGILPEYWEQPDRWSDVLRYILGLPVCSCGNPQHKLFLFLDYEKSFSIEEAKTVILKTYTHKLTGDEISENTYNDKLIELSELREKEKLSAKDSEKISSLEVWLSEVDVTSSEVERLSTTDYIKLCGVDENKIIVTSPSTIEEGINMITGTKEYGGLIRSKEIDAIIWDSLQAAIPEYVDSREAQDATMGTEAKQNGLLMRKISSAYSPTDITDEKEAYLPPLFVTSQVRAKIGGFFPQADTYSGGKAVEHFISTAIEVKRGDHLTADGTPTKDKNKNVIYGQQVHLRAEKNKLATPFASCTYNYYFKESDMFPVGLIDYHDEIITIAVDHGIIHQGGGGNYTYKDKKVRGKVELVNQLKQDPTFILDIYKEIKNLV